MHDQGIVHGAIQGVRGCALNDLLREADPPPKSNILIDKTGRGVLAGLGLLTIIPDKPIVTSSDPPDGTTRLVGSVWWTAPEVLKGEVSGKETDIYSFAMVMIEARHG